MPGLAEVILSNYEFGADDLMMVFSASGLSAVPVEMARGARRRGMKVIAVTSVAQSMSAEPDPVIGARLLDEDEAQAGGPGCLTETPHDAVGRKTKGPEP